MEYEVKAGETMKDDEKITLENFGAHNRSRIIGNSLYRICKAENISKNLWYIFESYNKRGHAVDSAMHRGYHNENLQAVIDILNSFAKEKEVIKMVE